MDPQQLSDLIVQKKWIALMALIIGLIVRLLKSDTKIPIDIPPQYRVWLALGLAPIAGAFTKWAAGTTWTTAMVEGFVAAVFAIVGHNVVIDSMRGGKEFVVPGLTKENTPPGPGKPPSIPPSAMNEKTMKDAAAGKDVDTSGLVRSIYRGAFSGFFIAPTRVVIFAKSPGRKVGIGKLFAPLVLAASFLLAACHLFTPTELPSTILNIKDIACIIEHAFVDDKTLNTICNLLTAEQQSAGREVAKSHRDSVKRQLATMKAESCDGGAADGGASK